MRSYKETTEYIYQTTATRLKNKKSELKLTNEELADKVEKVIIKPGYEDPTGMGEDEPEEYEIVKKKSKFDKSMISRILNNKKGIPKGKKSSPNPFLIPPAYISILQKKLKLNSEEELFWGNERERESDFYKNIFVNIVKDWVNIDYTMNKFDELLIDYISYAKNLTYWNIFFNNSKKRDYPAIFYGTRYYRISEDSIYENIEKDRTKAIDYLYLKCESEFKYLFDSFIKDHSNFKSLPKNLDNFVFSTLFPALKKFELDEDSLGLRVKNLIISDLSNSGEISYKRYLENPLSIEESFMEKKIIADIEYIVSLEKIQEEELMHSKNPRM